MVEPLHIALISAALWSEAVLLARAGLRVTLVEDDRDDFRRVSDMCERLRMPTFATSRRVPICDLILIDAPFDDPAEQPVLSLNWAHDQCPGVQLHLPERGPKVIELLGHDPSGSAANLAQGLQAQVVRLRSRVPASQQLLGQMSHAIEQLVLLGSSPIEVDAALCAEGFAFGPFAAQDRAGVDRVLAARRRIDVGNTETGLMARAVAEGRLGRAVGVGWFRYPGDTGLVEDPLIEDMAAEEARFAGIKQTFPDARQIVSEVRTALRDAAACIDLRPDDVNLVAQAALGLPPDFLI